MGTRKEYVRNWWDLSRGANVAWGISTIALGAVMMGVDYEEKIFTLVLHAFTIGCFIAGWFAINDLLVCNAFIFIWNKGSFFFSIKFD